MEPNIKLKKNWVGYLSDKRCLPVLQRNLRAGKTIIRLFVFFLLVAGSVTFSFSQTPVPSPMACYNFSGNLNEANGGTPLTAINNLGTFSTGNTLCALDSFYHTTVGSGLDLVVGNVFPLDHYTVELLFKFTSVPYQRSWQRIIDFKNNTSDQGLYLFQNNVQMYPSFTGISGIAQPNTWFRLFLTRDNSTGTVNVYVNNILELTFPDGPGQATFISDLILFKDDIVVQNEESDATIDFMRIYNVPLTFAQIQQIITSSAAPTVSVSGNLTLCAGSTTLTATSSATNYLWSTGATASSIVVSPTTTATYSLTAWNYLFCTKSCESHNTVTVTIGTLSVTATCTSATCGNNNATATINGGTSPYTYNWSNGQTAITATGLATGTYSVTVSDVSGCSSTQTVTVTSVNNTINSSATSTQAICSANNGTATVNASGGTNPFTYSWNNGQTTSVAVTLGSGSYTVTITDANGCTKTQTVTITSSSTLSVAVSATQASCAVNNGTATANAIGGTSPLTYSWNNGQTTQTAIGLSIGIYTAIVTGANGCVQTQTVNVTQVSGPTAMASASANIITAGAGTTLSATGGGTYSWSPSISLSCDTCSSPIATPSQTTSYCVVVADNNGCKDSACITIVVDTPCEPIYIPNAFSPNNDSENDLECVFGNCIETFHVRIYNRWGELVFESTDEKFCWDGTHIGKPLNSAVFDYHLEATLTSGEKINKKGNISLLR